MGDTVDTVVLVIVCHRIFVKCFSVMACAKAPGGPRRVRAFRTTTGLLKWFPTAGETVEMNIDIRAEAVHGDETKVASKVARI
jgi:hypothetical protein